MTTSTFKPYSSEQQAQLLARLNQLGLHGVSSPVTPAAASPAVSPALPAANLPLPELSLIFFSGASASQGRMYDLLLAAARFADKAGFKALWTPERHFQDIGGPYPNPAVLGAAMAMVTEQLRIHAGSINLPLHDSLRVAEEWAVVDNLSGGRVDVAIAPGWHAGDFILRPDSYETRRELASTQMEEVRALWRGTPVKRAEPSGKTVDVLTFPRPLQKELPVWLTISQNEQAWAMAGRLGVNVLTALINHSLDGLGQRIAVYRAARAEAGLDPAGGTISLMLHTYVGEVDADVKELVRPALSTYLGSFLSQQDKLNAGDQRFSDVRALVREDTAGFVEFVFERYYTTCSLLGSPERCAGMLRKTAALGISEVACLIDFGLDHATVMEGLERLAQLRSGMQQEAAAALQAHG